MKTAQEKLAEVALAIWRERELQFPERVRRMTPDATDMVTGAWNIVIEQAMLLSETAPHP